jgi:ribonuclease E
MIQAANQEAVRRRLLECLSRDRTKNQVSEITSLGLVQMTRKKIGVGLLETYSETCECCGGRGLVIHDEPRFKAQEVQVKKGKKKEKPEVKKVVTGEAADALMSVVNKIASAATQEAAPKPSKEPEDLLNQVLDALPEPEEKPTRKPRRASSIIGRLKGKK